jgi:hypothetical protein
MTTAPVRGRREERARRERRHGALLLMVTVILVVIALGTTAAALVVRRDTDDVHANAQPVHREIRELAATEADAERRMRLLEERGRATTEALAVLFAAEQAQVDASNHAVDVANQAADQYNDAQTTDLAAAFGAAGDAALTDLEAKTQAVRSAAEAARRAVASLQEAAGG